MEENKPKEMETDIEISTIRTAFRPLGMVAKCFGLFPCYDLSFTKKLSSEKLRVIHILDYCYSGLIFTLMTAGAVLCSVRQPVVIKEMMSGSEKTDFYVIMTVFYMTMIMGIISLSIFPKKFSLLLHYIEHFSSIDKLLDLPQSNHQTEVRFGKRLLTVLGFELIVIVLLFYFMFIMETPDVSKPYTDYLLIAVEALAGMARIIPCNLLIFFMNSIRMRLTYFNSQIQKLIQPITPSCFTCDSFTNYGEDVNRRLRSISSRKSFELAGKLEKMRILHEEISELMSETSLIFGSHLLRDFLYSILGIILYCYFIFFLREENLVFWFIYPFMVLLIIMKLIGLSSFAQFITNEVRIL